MENKDYKNMSLEEIAKEYDSCFDENDNVINQEKFAKVLENPEIRKRIFSREQLVRNASQEKDLILKGAAERFLGTVYPPSWHWKMPDYYYPGFFVDSLPTDPVPDFFDTLGKKINIALLLF